MSKKVWFITGASRGMGVDFAKAALAAGHAVVASGRDIGRLSQALGQSNWSSTPQKCKWL
jgi:NAD(P)-dependent dehydrogenase (short-subunit alcohol dehydrogenase family)